MTQLQMSNKQKASINTSAKKSALLSVIFMGLGQIYNKQYVKGLLLIALELYLLIFWSKPFQTALWGLYTLGETPQVRDGRGRITEIGDHSIFLMIQGIIIILAFLLFLWLYYFNIRDAYKTGLQRDQGMPVRNFSQSIQHLKEQGYPFILLLPAILFTVFVTVLPLAFGILLAFTNYSSPNYLPPRNLVDWIGLKSFIDLFKLKSWSTTFYGVFTWTVIWAIMATVTTYFVGLFYALMINAKGIKFKKFWRAIYILPWAVPQFVSILIFRNIFNGQFGPINNFLVSMGFDRIPFLTDANIAKFTLIGANLWFGLPFWLILMTGVLTGIDQDLYEAAEVDGATDFQKFKNITLPLVLFATAPLLIMSFATNFNNFNIIYLFTDGGPANSAYSYAGSTDILISWIYKLTLDHGKYNIASVVSILIFVVIASISIWNFRRTRAFKEEDMIQ